MATATIPELIQPGTLYTPDDSAVSVASGHCPNGDDALLIAGSTADFRAYQPAIDGIHYQSAVSDPFSILLWVQLASTDTSGTNTQPLNTIMAGVMDISWAATSPISPTGTSSTGGAWTLGLKSSAFGSLLFLRAVGATGWRGGTTSSEAASSIRMFAFVDDGTGSGSVVYTNGNSSGGSTVATGTVGTPGALTAPFFSLGPYSTNTTQGAWRFPTGNHYIAKFSLWDRALTVNELSDLYQSMTLGPPSP